MRWAYFGLLFFALLFVSEFANAQHKFALDVGYHYMKGSRGYLGAEYRLDSNDGVNRHGPFNIGVGGLVYSQENKTKIVPEMHINKTWRHFIVTEVSSTTKYIEPSLGLTFFNLVRVQTGYNVPFKKQDAGGFTFAVRVLIGRSPYYDEITVY